MCHQLAYMAHFAFYSTVPGELEHDTSYLELMLLSIVRAELGNDELALQISCTHYQLCELLLCLINCNDVQGKKES